MAAGAAILTPADQTRTLAALVRRIFGETRLPRLRLSSIEPMDWDRDLIALMAEFGGTRLAPPRAPSPSVRLRLRPAPHVSSLSSLALRGESRTALSMPPDPALTLGADVMVGFPGETDREFDETLDFIRALPFGYLHLFPFSPRPGTRAWTLHAESPVPAAVVEARMAALRALAAEKTRAHRSQFIGRELDAITLHTPRRPRCASRTSALTENFLPVELDGLLPANQLVRIRVTGTDADNTARRNPCFTRTSTPIPNSCQLHTSAAEPVLRNRLLSHQARESASGIQPVLYSGCVRAPCKSSGTPRIEAHDNFGGGTIALDKRSAKSFIRINDRIRAREIRVIDENGEQLGILAAF